MGDRVESASRWHEFHADQYARSLFRGNNPNQSAGERFKLMQDAIDKLNGSSG